MFRPVPTIIRSSSERVSVFTASVWLCNDGKISSSVVFDYYYNYKEWWGGSVMWVLC